MSKRPLSILKYLILLVCIHICMPLLALENSDSKSGKSTSKKILIVILENEKFENAIGEPYLAKISEQGGLLKNYHGVAHPSQPNYVALVAGDTCGITSDRPVTLDQKNIVDLLEARGKTWKVYAEDYPGNCSLVSRTKQYAKKHNPLISFKNIQDDPRRCGNIVNAGTFQQDLENDSLPDFAMYIPDQLHSGHDSDVKTSSKWLKKFLDPLLKHHELMNNLLVIVTFDEDYIPTPKNQIYAVFLGRGIRRGSATTESYNHYNMLRTIEDYLGLETLGKNDAKARSISGIWQKEIAQEKKDEDSMKTN